MEVFVCFLMDVLAWGQASCAPVLTSTTFILAASLVAAATPAPHLSPWANDRWWLLAGGFTYHTVHRLVISCEVGNGLSPIFQLRMLRLKDA